MGLITVITSGKGGAGKSTVSVGLGCTLAKNGKRVLLIDGDAGLRSLDAMLGVDKELVFDISDIVNGNCEPIKAIYSCEEYTGLNNLFLLPAPALEKHTIHPELMKQLVPILARYYDHVIIDCPAGIGKGFISNTTQLPDTGRTPVVYVSPDQPLFIIPVISPWLKKATAKEERFFIGLFLLSTCMPYLNRWWGEVWGQCFWNEFHMLFYFSGFLGYLVMAHYMHTHLTWSRSKRLRTGIALMIIGAVWTIYSFYIQAIPGENLSTPVIEIGWAFCTINCVLLTTGTFLMFSCINQPKSPRLITEISKLSYGMYLMHIFWLGLWVTVFKHNLAFPTVAAIPCIAATTFICCFVTTKIISLIPGSKWIIG